MNKQEEHNNGFASPRGSNIQDSRGNSRITDFMVGTYSRSTFYFVSGILQSLLGLCVITVGVVGLLQPIWLSRSLIMVASVNTIIGVYLVYITASKYHDSRSLLRDAMQRVTKYKN